MLTIFSNHGKIIGQMVSGPRGVDFRPRPPGRDRIVGVDPVEVNSLYDPAEITGLLASQLIVEEIVFIFTPRV